MFVCFGKDKPEPEPLICRKGFLITIGISAAVVVILSTLAGWCNKACCFGKADGSHKKVGKSGKTSNGGKAGTKAGKPTGGGSNTGRARGSRDVQSTQAGSAGSAQRRADVGQVGGTPTPAPQPNRLLPAMMLLGTADLAKYKVHERMTFSIDVSNHPPGSFDPPTFNLGLKIDQNGKGMVCKPPPGHEGLGEILDCPHAFELPLDSKVVFTILNCEKKAFKKPNGEEVHGVFYNIEWYKVCSMNKTNSRYASGHFNGWRLASHIFTRIHNPVLYDIVREGYSFSMKVSKRGETPSEHGQATISFVRKEDRRRLIGRLLFETQRLGSGAL